ncbi:hypothetical protein D7X74_31745 [Corallococcus sp. CA047B]|uniref:hypothetical protein n=1 Tax=Corallococcus sp. CA047B TaxID=2316729 RepID=UPI000EA14F5F|nr:hypothetical protein [Corallococcus sp. CA047B]RKH08357.1 hypothetical protein D7X74_31745 [Corallococcus sp. CA047B]
MTAAREGREDAGPFPPPGAPALNCPGCKSKVADDTAICPECDYIIDKSFLAGAEEESGGDESTGVGPQPKARPSAPVPRARPAPTRSKPGVKAATPPAGDDSTNVRSMDDIAKERAQRPPTRSGPAAKAAPGRSTAARRAPAPVPRDEDDLDSDGGSPDPWARDSRDSSRSPIEDPEVLLADARNFLGELEGSDRIAFWGAALVVLSCFMPWKETAADGDFLGLISLGFISFLFAVSTMVFIGIRVRNVMAWVNPMIPWGAQTASSVICLVWSLIFLKISSDTTLVPSPLGNSEMMNSSPSIGCFLGVLGAVVALLGSLMGLRRPAE